MAYLVTRSIGPWMTPTISFGFTRLAVSSVLPSPSWTPGSMIHRRSVQATLFDVSDGVRTHSDVSAVQDVTKASDGRIWYVAYDGVSVIDPRHFPFNKVPPPVHIEQVTADRKTYDAAKGCVCPALVREPRD